MQKASREPAYFFSGVPAGGVVVPDLAGVVGEPQPMVPQTNVTAKNKAINFFTV